MRRQGFTLLEMMTVALILAVLTALSLVSLRNVQWQSRVGQELRRHAARLQQARTLAITTGDCHGVFLGADGSATLITINGVDMRAAGRAIVFRRRPGQPCTAFDDDFRGPNGNRNEPVSNEFIGAEHESARRTAAGVTVDQARGVANSNPYNTGTLYEVVGVGPLINQNDFVVLFDPMTAMPTFLTGNPAGRNLVPPGGAPPRVRLQLRSLAADPFPGSLNKLNNPSVRQLDIGPGGSVGISDCQGIGTGANNCVP